ncbi:CarD family transcriptional regulator [Candidatus Dependentiae bacterium Noda2021]|nr:CarD family transcriptional regulator [Candidatus Dependentiae bacterium Noda2021]
MSSDLKKKVFYPDLDEKVVFPGHGVAKVNRIIEKQVAGTLSRYFELKFLNKEMTILVPTQNFETIGIRKLSSTEKINDIFKILSEPARRITPDSVVINWNKRSKKYLSDMRTGNLVAISKIYRDLKHISHYKELSFGEKNLLSQTESFLAQEISLVNNVAEEKAIERLRALFNNLSRTMIDHTSL